MLRNYVLLRYYIKIVTKNLLLVTMRTFYNVNLHVKLQFTQNYKKCMWLYYIETFSWRYVKYSKILSLKSLIQ